MDTPRQHPGRPQWHSPSLRLIKAFLARSDRMCRKLSVVCNIYSYFLYIFIYIYIYIYILNYIYIHMYVIPPGMTQGLQRQLRSPGRARTQAGPWRSCEVCGLSTARQVHSTATGNRQYAYIKKIREISNQILFRFAVFR